jgi:hypothetical protein
MPKCTFSPNSVVCGSKWRRTTLQKDLCNANAVNASGTRSVTVALHPGAWPGARFTRQELVSPQNKKLHVVAAEEITLKTTVVAVSEKRRRQLLQCERYGNVVKGMVFLRACLRLNLLHISQLLKRRHLARARTTLSEGGRTIKTHATCPKMPTNFGLDTQSEIRPPNRAVHSQPLVLKRRQGNPTYHAPTMQT